MGVPIPDVERRFIFVVQNSGTMNTTDPDRLRRSLVLEGITALDSDKSRFALVEFSDEAQITDLVPTPDEDQRFQTVLDRLNEVDNLAVFDGALQRTRNLIQSDLVATSTPATPIRYHVILIHDGTPRPNCTADPDINPLCDVPRDLWGMFLLDPNNEALYFGFDGDTTRPYNRPVDTLQRVDEITALSAETNAHSVSVHSILLYDESIVDTPMETSLGLHRGNSVSYSNQVAFQGNGTFSNDYPSTIDWVQLLYWPM